MSKETLGDLIKGYEANYNITLPKRTPVIVRIDGKAFHTFTRGFNKPFDQVFVGTMQDTMLALCKSIQSVQFGYVESDEISLLIYETNTEADPWFGNRLQKICSMTASMATMQFNKNFAKRVNEFYKEHVEDNFRPTEDDKQYEVYKRSLDLGGMFDSRVFVVPESVIVPYFIWRQNDATRNSINSLGQKHFSHKSLQGLTCNDIQNKLLTEKDINWNNEPTVHKRGTCAYKVYSVDDNERSEWVLDKDMPILMDNRNFVMSKIQYPTEGY